MQDYFFPNSHRSNTPTKKLIPGQQRVATFFETYIEFMNEGKLRVPTREKSKVIQNITANISYCFYLHNNNLLFLGLEI